MILNAIAAKLKRRSKDDFKGRHFEAGLNLFLKSEADREHPVLLADRPGTREAESLAQPQHSV